MVQVAGEDPAAAIWYYQCIQGQTPAQVSGIFSDICSYSLFGDPSNPQCGREDGAGSFLQRER